MGLGLSRKGREGSLPEDELTGILLTALETTKVSRYKNMTPEWRTYISKALATIKPEKWTKEFSALRKAHTDKEVKQVLTWYCKNFGMDGLPVALSAAAFRRKYDMIKRAMEINTGKEHSAHVRITEEVTEIVRNMKDDWPESVHEQLAPAVQLSYDNFSDFLDKVNAFYRPYDEAANPYRIRNKNTKVPRIAYIAMTLLAEIGESPGSATYQWFRVVRERVLFPGSSWNGRFRKYIFDPRSPILRQIGERISIDFCGNDSLWYKLMETVGYESV